MVVVASRKRDGPHDPVQPRVDHRDHISGLHHSEHHPRARVVLDIASVSAERDRRDPAASRAQDYLGAARLSRDKDVPLDRVERESVWIVTCWRTSKNSTRARVNGERLVQGQ